MDLQDIGAAMRDFDGKLADLSGRLNETGVLDKNRDFLAERIGDIKNSRQQAVDTLQRDHGITPQEIADRITSLRSQADRANQEHAAAAPKRAVPEPVIKAKTPHRPEQHRRRPEREQERELGRSR
jgi:hypothetical protein